MKYVFVLLLVLTASAVPAAVGAAGAGQDPSVYRSWIENMKLAPRGPFARLRWFCADGSVLPPEPHACRERGGGHQHGEWSAETLELRERGYKVANVLAGVDASALVAGQDFDDTWAQLLIERYLIGADDGWIMRRAMFYRGAVQEEGERDGARALLSALVAESRWIDTRFAALRAGARLLPHGQDSASAQRIRQESAALEQRDPGFARLRAKIHGSPEAGDAGRVRAYAETVTDGDLQARYETLADDIVTAFSTPFDSGSLEAAAAAERDAELRSALLRHAAALENDDSPLNRFRVSSRLLADLRDTMPSVAGPAARIRLLDWSLRAEQAGFAAAAELRDAVEAMTRAERLAVLESAIDASYGCGLVKKRERDYQNEVLASFEAGVVPLDDYMTLLRQLGRMPGWGTQNLRFLFFESMKKLSEIEPKAMLFIQDQLRGSPLLFFSRVLDGLSRDANLAAGVRHQVFGEEVGVGLKALNPGLAVGTLHTRIEGEALEHLEPDGIYLLPETISDLPPVAGILTGGEGNPLSHVQLLARNLGIPNVNVDDDVIQLLDRHDGRRVLLAVSVAGLVQVADADSPLGRRLAGEQTSGDVVIRPEPGKLALQERRFVSLDELRAEDSGVIVGPKAAKLGELKSAFPDAVAEGVAIPFGLFKAEVLDRPYRDGARTVFEWMVESYASIGRLPDSERTAPTEAFRAELYEQVVGSTPSAEFRENLRQAMLDTFGNIDEGVFVRSDTNVEDLPGFTGAGLNLTLPNVVGFHALLDGIPRVWASPFTERAFAWRQAHMENPEHVYTSILLLRSVAADKSGVLVTQDLDDGDRRALSVAVNEGVGGAVDGQAAESLRIDTRDGSVRLLATATAPWRRRPAAAGGIAVLPASGSDTVLVDTDIERLITFARDELPVRFRAIVDDRGAPAAADVEFGFENGELRLFQVRPFLQSRGAAGSTYLMEMDRALTSTAGLRIDLNEHPGE